MSLAKCKACGHEVSKKADKCPNCGEPLKRKTVGCGGAIAVVFLLAVILAALGSVFNKSSPAPTSSSHSSTVSKQPPPTPPKQPGSQWIYHSFADEMSGKNTYQAAVQSTNTVNFDFPYSGPQRGTLALRTHPRHGKDLIFKIEQGQLLCSSYDGCSVLAKFDDAAAIRYEAAAAADNSTETLFIQNYSGFVEKMLSAKTVRIEARVYQEGNPVFEFDVSGFNQAKYLPDK